MATAKQARDAYVKRNLGRLVRDVTWDELDTVLNEPQNSNRVMAAVRNGNKKLLFDTIRKALEDAAREKGETEADGYLADNTLSLAELDGWL